MVTPGGDLPQLMFKFLFGFWGENIVKDKDEEKQKLESCFQEIVIFLPPEIKTERTQKKRRQSKSKRQRCFCELLGWKILPVSVFCLFSLNVRKVRRFLVNSSWESEIHLFIHNVQGGFAAGIVCEAKWTSGNSWCVLLNLPVTHFGIPTPQTTFDSQWFVTNPSPSYHFQCQSLIASVFTLFLRPGRSDKQE